jgi:hypothetical protein
LFLPLPLIQSNWVWSLAIVASSPSGSGNYRFFDFCLGDIGNLLQLNVGDIGQLICRNHAVDNRRSVGFKPLVDRLAQFAGLFRLEGCGATGEAGRKYRGRLDETPYAVETYDRP